MSEELSKFCQNRKEGTKTPKSNEKKVDKNGHLVLPKGFIIFDRYEIQTTIGSGTFGRVFEVKDIHSDHHFAMKVSREKKRTSDDSEVKALKQLKALDLNKSSLVVNLIDSFALDNRVFIIMELLGISLFNFMSLNHLQPFRSPEAVQICLQILQGLQFLHSHNYMHTDIKPENIVFVCADYQVLENPIKTSKYAKDLESPKEPFWKDYKKLKSTEIRLVDFGSALRLEDGFMRRKGRIGTVEYSSPESILLLNWSFPSDVWSLGLTFADIWIGTTLSRVKSIPQIFLRFETIFGPMPLSFLKDAPAEFLEYRKKCVVDRKWNKYGDFISPSHHKPTRLFNYFEMDDPIQVEAFGLISKLLKYKPEDRLTVEQALKHRLFEISP